MNKKLILPAAVLLVFLYIVIGSLAYKASQELEEVVTDQFNQQQLILAGKIADDIRNHCQFLETALTTLSRHAGERPEPPSRDYLHSTFELLKDWHVLSLGIDPDGRDNSLFESKREISSWKEMGVDFPEAEFERWLDSGPEEQIFFSRTFRPDQGPFAGTWVMFMARPLYSRVEDPDFSSPGASPDGPAVAFFLVNAMEVSGEYAHGVVSGKTGYSWVINEKGYFLYHIEEDFIGRNSFTVRHDRNPHISYERVNYLVKEKLLQGQEGANWYISGWHRDQIAEMKKLIAYSPIIFSPGNSADLHLWSVGVAAPNDEVWGLMHPVVIRQWLVAGLFLLGATLGLFALYFVSLRWNHALTRKVDEKTRHLTHSQELLFQEKQKVEQSMEELVKTQQKLIQAERFAAIGEAAAHLSHEIKNPLMLMAGFARQVRRKLPGNSPENEKLGIISKEALRLEKMLIEVRDFTRPHKLQIDKHRINRLISDVLKIFEDEMQRLNIRCTLDLQADLPPVDMDRDQIQQVLINLIKNSMEVMPEGGVLIISSGLESGRIRTSVQDSGVGIPPDKMKNIFSPFFTTKDKGTGLGLAISYRIVQDHGGDIFVDSEPGKGTRFTFYLPLNGD